MVIVGTRNRKAEQRKWHDFWLSQTKFEET